MIAVSPTVHFAAHRFGLVARAGARKVGGTPPHVSEFALPGGAVVARKVTVGDSVECWLTVDLATAAEQALHAEAAESARIAAEVIGWSLGRDQARAAEQGLSVEQYRNKRNFQLQRIDARRGVNSRGMR